jgi:hypothetical protein
MARSLSRNLTSIETLQSKLDVKKAVLLERAMMSDNPNDIIKANQMIQNIQKRETGNRKSFVIDPQQFTSYMGYKDKAYSLSYNILRKMARGSMVINAIVKTRQDQVASFCEPQTDRYSTGFVIRKKPAPFSAENDKPTVDDQKRIELLTEFVLNCGRNNSWEADDFDTFARKIVWDSLVYDQMNFEVSDDFRGIPFEFGATDAATMRLAESFDDETYKNKDKVAKFGYFPSYCQVIDGRVQAEFYPWEMCFGVRNPTTNIYHNGYGMSELEDLINTVTAMLWADEYNRKFFSQGSSPKGMLKVKNGALNSTSLQEFKQQWSSMVSGVMNAWRTPILEGDVEWIDLQKSNTDMQFDKYQEFLIKISCAVFRIDPAEINFPLGGESGGGKAMFEGNNEARLKHSKDKGLYPLLKMIQRKINRYIIQRLDPRFEFIFTGMEGLDMKTELDNDVTMMSNFMTINEIRTKRGLETRPDGDVIANAVWLQYQNMKMMSQQGGQGGDDGQEDFEGDNDLETPSDNGQEDAEQGEEGASSSDNGEEDNPFSKALETFLVKL